MNRFGPPVPGASEVKILSDEIVDETGLVVDMRVRNGTQGVVTDGGGSC